MHFNFCLTNILDHLLARYFYVFIRMFLIGAFR